jgi:hypothetical protein
VLVSVAEGLGSLGFASSSGSNFAISVSIAAGVVVEAQRFTTFPFGSIKNFSKFHYRIPVIVSNCFVEYGYGYVSLYSVETEMLTLIL